MGSVSCTNNLTQVSDNHDTFSNKLWINGKSNQLNKKPFICRISKTSDPIWINFFFFEMKIGQKTTTVTKVFIKSLWCVDG